MTESTVDEVLQQYANGKRIFRFASIVKADFRGADLSYADLRNTKFSGANFSQANLRGANLGAADLSGATLSNAQLGQALLGQTNFSGAKLCDAALWYSQRDWRKLRRRRSVSDGLDRRALRQRKSERGKR